jgi:hypothetical protein
MSILLTGLAFALTVVGLVTDTPSVHAISAVIEAIDLLALLSARIGRQRRD